MAAATITSQMAIASGAANLGSLAGPSSSCKTCTFRLATVCSRLVTSLVGRVRCDARDNGTEVREAMDRATKKTVTEEHILRNQQTNESEKKSVFGTEPTSGSLQPRPEVDWRQILDQFVCIRWSCPRDHQRPLSTMKTKPTLYMPGQKPSLQFMSFVGS